MSWVAIFLAITGLIFGFQWFAKSVYWITSGGQVMVEHKQPVSDTTKPATIMNVADHSWQQQSASNKRK